jgi:hypothetical protein
MTAIRRCLLGIALALLIAGHAFAGEPVTPPEHRRSAEQTYLTFPEWYLVHSPAEYAAYLEQRRPPSGFPLFAHIGQFWQGYAAVTRATDDQPFNAGYHLMVMVIGISTTVEYALKGLYEHTMGRLAEAIATAPPDTPEDRFAAQVARQYVDFIRVEPWYLFDFDTPLARLWTGLPGGRQGRVWRDDVRRWERRFALTSEYLVKAGYARLIKWATGAIYDAPRPVTAVLLSGSPAAADDTALKELTVLRQLDGGEVLVTVPRYEAFTAYVRALAGQPMDFTEIAGNRGDILVSVIANGLQPSLRWRSLFSQPIITEPGRQRLVLVVPVPELAQLLRGEGAGWRVEHVYDY